MKPKLEHGLNCCYGLPCEAEIYRNRNIVVMMNCKLEVFFSFTHRHMMQEGGDNIKHALNRLVKSVLLNTPDRSEYRVKVSQVLYLDFIAGVL